MGMLRLTTMHVNRRTLTSFEVERQQLDGHQCNSKLQCCVVFSKEKMKQVLQQHKMSVIPQTFSLVKNILLNVLSRPLLSSTVIAFLALHWKSLPLAYHLRFAVLILRPKPDLLTEGTVHRDRLLLDDLDFNLHMNNSTYNKHGDFARVGLFLSSGLHQVIRKRGWWYANGGVYFSFRREIKPFSLWTIHSKLHSYDTKWLFFEHKYEVDGQVAAVGFSKFVIKTRDRKDVAPLDVLKALIDSDPSSSLSLTKMLERPPNWSGSQFGADLLNIEKSLNTKLE
ncbi:hypothetical protein PROFUN_11691 [Planoprotostelium fungivorum]|uniref:Thioesterase n=1 Tax=Planoprotostelium fungivorum TaxID=1890364 RepID=A0A2P6N5A6_9EUKA|nr:hypothetical protein PROFUN_11691 [Planoprotostelium fungivorum]